MGDRGAAPVTPRLRRAQRWLCVRFCRGLVELLDKCLPPARWLPVFNTRVCLALEDLESRDRTSHMKPRCHGGCHHVRSVDSRRASLRDFVLSGPCQGRAAQCSGLTYLLPALASFSKSLFTWLSRIMHSQNDTSPFLVSSHSFTGARTNLLLCHVRDSPFFMFRQGPS